jgi:ribonuclease HI
MVYVIEIYVDGGCRRNGFSNAIAAAAAIRKERGGRRYWHRQRRLSGHHNATNQRAELTAIILGLEMALEKYNELDTNPRLNVTIHSDSKYAVNCMNAWIYKWAQNGWINSRGEDVANRDLIEEASNMDDRLAELGDIKYLWIPRSENEVADKHCNQELNAMEEDEDMDDSDDDHW